MEYLQGWSPTSHTPEPTCRSLSAYAAPLPLEHHRGSPRPTWGCAADQHLHCCYWDRPWEPSFSVALQDQGALLGLEQTNAIPVCCLSMEPSPQPPFPWPAFPSAPMAGTAPSSRQPLSSSCPLGRPAPGRLHLLLPSVGLFGAGKWRGVVNRTAGRHQGPPDRKAPLCPPSVIFVLFHFIHFMI